VRKTIGALLVGLGAILCLAALYSVLVSILPSIGIVVSSGAAYAWGRLVGGIVATALFAALGIKAIKAGRRRFSSVPPESSTNA
jgi:hypothetical protein